MKKIKLKIKILQLKDELREVAELLEEAYETIDMMKKGIGEIEPPKMDKMPPMEQKDLDQIEKILCHCGKKDDCPDSQSELTVKDKDVLKAALAMPQIYPCEDHPESPELERGD